MVDPNVSFHKYDNTERLAFNIISNPSLSLLNGLSIPSGFCVYKNKNNERSFPKVVSGETIKGKCIAEGVYDNLFNLACYKSSRKRGRTRNLKKNYNNSAGKKTSYKNKQVLK